MLQFDHEQFVLLCEGDEDCSTQARRRRALSRALRAKRDVVVDMSGLQFADPSLMLDLAMLARRMRLCGKRLRLRGAQPHIRTLIELVGLHRLPSVQLEGPSPALS
jgi:anti-anti-sigma factor